MLPSLDYDVDVSGSFTGAGSGEVELGDHTGARNTEQHQGVLTSVQKFLRSYLT